MNYPVVPFDSAYTAIYLDYILPDLDGNYNYFLSDQGLVLFCPKGQIPSQFVNLKDFEYPLKRLGIRYLHNRYEEIVADSSESRYGELHDLYTHVIQALKSQLYYLVREAFDDQIFSIELAERKSTEGNYLDFFLVIKCRGANVRLENQELEKLIIQRLDNLSQASTLVAIHTSFLPANLEFNYEISSRDSEFVPEWYRKEIFRDVCLFELYPGTMIEAPRMLSFSVGSSEFALETSSDKKFNLNLELVEGFRTKDLYLFASGSSFEGGADPHQVSVLARDIGNRITHHFETRLFPRATPLSFIRSRQLQRTTGGCYVLPIKFSSQVKVFDPLEIDMIFTTVTQLAVFLYVLSRHPHEKNLQSEMEIYFSSGDEFRVYFRTDYWPDYLRVQKMAWISGSDLRGVKGFITRLTSSENENSNLLRFQNRMDGSYWKVDFNPEFEELAKPKSNGLWVNPLIRSQLDEKIFS